MSKIELVNNSSLFKFEITPRNTPVANLFSDHEYPWQLLSKIRQSVKSLVDTVSSAERLKGNISSEAFIDGDEVVVEKGAVVEPFAYITGPTYICAGAVVRRGAYIRGGVYIGPGAIAGHTTEVKDSILMAEAKAAHFAYVGNSVLGEHTNLGAGTKLANLRIDNQAVKLRFDGEKIDSGQRKFGAIFGDRAQSGCNSVTNPGTILLPEAGILPCKNVSGLIDNQLAKVVKPEN